MPHCDRIALLHVSLASQQVVLVAGKPSCRAALCSFSQLQS